MTKTITKKYRERTEFEKLDNQATASYLLSLAYICSLGIKYDSFNLVVIYVILSVIAYKIVPRILKYKRIK